MVMIVGGNSFYTSRAFGAAQFSRASAIDGAAVMHGNGRASSRSFAPVQLTDHI
jgi:hypothetical protein